MKMHFDTHGNRDCSNETEYYLSKTQMQIEMVHNIIKYACVKNKYDFNHMIDSLKPNITDDGHTDELSNINSPSPYIVDLTLFLLQN